ncbi:type I-E CRISPR-associated protein Cse1/CasA [Bradymonas sediminis]|uniref:Type I-E CRISPR-associated protein Cse1/CasA n=1 Tax=Bradymonas sediminis TaxID=1548548 RepID=A0A2Z4FH50_9DELT|nr:type I-E CRISPR-associated protein Cse1/CasA [Bradymonas sediminis]AWV88249.1 type I-E CRISPR-associated protein Cse1/CasA [Bradymonas sediminis]TDP77372.1 CRISPR system Cascade subunit CasA [Bradymonas sediminis]
MADTRYNLLDDALLSVRRTDATRLQYTLPQVLAALADDAIESFDALQIHQRQPWHSFLVQIAAMAMARHGLTEPPTDSEQWNSLLLELADGEPSAWCLVVEDVSKPAFLQPPVPEGTLKKAKYKLDIESPDDLDILITAKNHDIKRFRLVHPTVEHWLYALLTLQTMEGFLGRGNYGIARMNGGFGNRPLLGMTPGIGWGARFVRDVAVLAKARPKLTDDRYDENGVALAWTLPWDGSKKDALPLQDCDPYFIELCRRLRFLETAHGLECWRSNTNDYRVAGVKELNGLTGDPWTPVVRDKKEAKSLTVSENGFDYQMLNKILFSGDYEKPATFNVEGIDGGVFLVATTLVRGQGKTDGFHHRIVPMPPKINRLWSKPSAREKLGQRAEERVQIAATMRKQILYPSLCALLQAGGSAQIDYADVATWMNAYEAEVDDVFFDALWESVDLEPEVAQFNWEETIYTIGRARLEAAIESCPLPSIRRWRAISNAEGRFEGAARKFLSTLFQPKDITKEESHEQLAGA